MLVKAAAKGYIGGFLGDVFPRGVVSLQYVDDTLLFLEHSYLAACRLKGLMVCFEQISGMKINYHKSDLTTVNLEEFVIQEYAKEFCCQIGGFPFK
jgi:hypothetical protein